METNVLKKTAKGTAIKFAQAGKDSLSVESIFLTFLQGENQFSKLINKNLQNDEKDSFVDINLLKNDLRTTIEEGSTTAINRLFLSDLPDRYLDDDRLIIELLNNPIFKNVFVSVFGKYFNMEHFQEDFLGSLSPKPNLEWGDTTQSILSEVGKNLTEKYIQGELPAIVGRDEEINRIVSILNRQTKSNPILLGEAGVGKTAIVEKLAGVFAEDEVPNKLKGWKVVEIITSKFLALGEKQGFETMIPELIADSLETKSILFVDEFHLLADHENKIINLFKPALARGDIKLIGATTENEFKIFEKDEALLRRMASVKIQEPNTSLVYDILKTKADEIRDFHNILIPPISLIKAIHLSDRFRPDRKQPDKAIDLIEEAASELRLHLESKPEKITAVEQEISELEIKLEMDSIQENESDVSERHKKELKKLRDKLSAKQSLLKELNKQFSVQIEMVQHLSQAIKQLSADKKEYSRLLQAANFEKAAIYKTEILSEDEKNIIEFEDKIVQLAEQDPDNNLIKNVVTPEVVGSIIAKQTGIPITAQGDDDLEKYRTIDENLLTKIHGQDKPIKTMVEAIKRNKAGLSDKNKPIGSFLCFGPTGVGKTYFAQTLTEYIFDTQKVLKRFDMSEYMEGHSVARLFGSPPGYVGYGEGGQLTEAIKRNPYSVILFDEIEKAHPKVFDALLQILDAGRMTDGQGHVIDFKNTVIIMTSNIGADIIKDGLLSGEDIEMVQKKVFKVAADHFRPEFLNRFDAKVMFNALDASAITKIAARELETIAERLHQDNHLDLNWHPNIPALITKKAWNLVDGARPVKRYLNDSIMKSLTDMILEKKISNGDSLWIPWDKNTTELTLIKASNKELKSFKKEAKKDGVLVVQTDFPKEVTSSSKITATDQGDNFINFKTELGD